MEEGATSSTKDKPQQMLDQRGSKPQSSDVDTSSSGDSMGDIVQKIRFTLSSKAVEADLGENKSTMGYILKHPVCTTLKMFGDCNDTIR